MNNLINYIWFFSMAIIVMVALSVVLVGLFFLLGGLV